MAIRRGDKTSGTILTNLPAGYRPANDMVAIVQTNSGTGIVNVGSSGTVKLADALPDNGYAFFDLTYIAV